MGNLWFELTGEYYKSVKKLESTVRHFLWPGVQIPIRAGDIARDAT